MTTVCIVLIKFIEYSQPPLKILIDLQGLDKFAHFVALGVLASLIFGILNYLNHEKSFLSFLKSLLNVAILGLSDERYQLANSQRPLT